MKMLKGVGETLEVDEVAERDLKGEEDGRERWRGMQKVGRRDTLVDWVG
jgi:hypothetical protein